jgi:circadian clock protein KaiC
MVDDKKFLQRFPSGTPGFDAMTGGGMFVGGIYLVVGRPGLGKTILANQISYHHAAEGGRVVYVTLLSESHARLILSLEKMTFFRADAVGDSVHYISGFKALEKEKLTGLTGLLRKVVRERKATLLVIDGLVTAGALADSAVEMKLFIHELQSLVELVGCCALLLTGAENGEADTYAQRTMVDGIVALSAKRVGMQTVRELEVNKHRGSDHVMGASFYEISAAGIRIYPRIEVTIGLAGEDAGPERPPLPTGIRGLDAMLNGGLQPASTTLVLGTPGSGKTLFGLNFLAAGSQSREAGLYFGFLESPARIVAKARSIGLDLPPADQPGGVQVAWNAAQEELADRLVERLLESVRGRRVKRLFIDSLAGFKRTLIYPERLYSFFTSLGNELRSLGVTTLVSEDTKVLFGPAVDISGDGTAAMVDSIVVLRSAEAGTRQRRLISLSKQRDSSYDPAVGELRITDRGLEVIVDRNAALQKSRGRSSPQRG